MVADRIQFTLRIAPEIMQKIKKIADENKRSATKQIEFIIEEFVKNNCPHD